MVFTQCPSDGPFSKINYIIRNINIRYKNQHSNIYCDGGAFICFSTIEIRKNTLNPNWFYVGYNEKYHRFMYMDKIYLEKKDK